MQTTFRTAKLPDWEAFEASLVAVPADPLVSSKDPVWVSRPSSIREEAFNRGDESAAKVTALDRAGEVLPYQAMVDLGFGDTWRHQYYTAPRIQLSQDARWDYIKEFGYALPCTEALELIASFGPVVEVGAGSGFWSKVLVATGVDIIATDNSADRYPFTVGANHDVVDMSADEAVRMNSDRAVLTIWQCMEDRWSEAVLDRMIAGQVLIYVGEGEGGCTATDRFHARVESDEFRRLELLDLPI